MKPAILLVAFVMVAVVTGFAIKGKSVSSMNQYSNGFGKRNKGKSTLTGSSSTKVSTQDTNKLWDAIMCNRHTGVSDESQFSLERIPQNRALVGSCVADVGTCPMEECSVGIQVNPNKNVNCPGVVCPVTKELTEDCGIFGERSYHYVTRCACCIGRQVVIKGTVADVNDGERLGDVKIRINNKAVTTSNCDGEFEATIDPGTESVVIRAEDKLNDYADAIKRVHIPDDVTGYLNLDLLMIPKAAPFRISSSMSHTLSLSSNPTDISSGNAAFEISADSFKDESGNVYDGNVDISLTFIDVFLASEAMIPAQFLTEDGENLISHGIFKFEFRSEIGDELKPYKDFKFTLGDEMRLWFLNYETATWDPALAFETGENEFSMNLANTQWINIDKISEESQCFFKATIFDELDQEVTSSNTAIFKPEIVAYTPEDERLSLYADGYTDEPSSTCFRAQCSVVENMDYSLGGFIKMSAVDMVLIGGTFMPFKSYLKPKPLAQYSSDLQQPLQDISYETDRERNAVLAYLNIKPSGPFYSTKDECESSSQSFHFLKPHPPSYEAVPAGTGICTSRIYFGDSTDEFLLAEGQPEVTAISVWESEGTKYYFTHTATIGLSTEGSENFYFACVQYRCSEKFNHTAVYLHIDIPEIEDAQTFSCTGSCSEPLCDIDQTGMDNSFRIDGSLVPPCTVHRGPDFYDSTIGNCKDRLMSESFAYEFQCSPIAAK